MAMTLRLSSSLFFPPSITTCGKPQPPPLVPLWTHHSPSLSSTTLRRVVSPSTSVTTLDSPVPPVVTTDDDDDDAVSAFWDYQFLFVSQRAESVTPISLRVVEGAIPADFQSGTYYLAGPGLFTDDHGSTVHPLDGHGYIRAFSVDGSSGEVRFSARYVATEARMEEQEETSGRWRFTHRGPFSVLKGGKKIGNVKVMKNVANTSVVKWGPRLLCLWEGGFPYEIAQGTLDTIGLFDVIDAQDLPVQDRVDRGWPNLFLDIATRFLKPVLHGVFQMPPKRLLSHYKIDARRNRLIIVSCNSEDMLLPRSNFTFYEFDTNFKLLTKREFSIPEHLMIHDWAFTDTHYLIFGNRIRLDVPGSLLAVFGFSPMISALSVDSRRPTSPVYLLPRFSDEKSHRDWRVPVEAPSQHWLIHAGNAFEQRDSAGNLEIKMYAAACSYQWFNFQKMFGYDWQSGKLDPTFMNPRDGREKLLPHLVQVTVALNEKRGSEECSIEPLNQWNRSSDFPAINPEFAGTQNKFIYASTCSGSRRFLPHFPFDSVTKINVQDGVVTTWTTRRRRFVGEPIFVPKGTDEDDGYLLLVEYAVSIQRCYLVVLDAKSIGNADALVARLEVPRNLNFPLGFHGFWAATK
ncbi:carotenoid cleavage dioxygenase 7, chloroplastic [Aristolochia californica]|uniref:carotenoid cleavage dioxygenase 7, chloroplastic n=1 Tax=Aristolochia californica TaxID=171875 RepID=UPI0035E2EF38